MSSFDDLPSETCFLLIRNAIDIGLVIRERRQKLGLDQEVLARRVKVSRQWIVEVEKGRPRAEVGLVLRTIDALGLTISIDPAGEAANNSPGAIPSVEIDDILDSLGDGRS
jgi:HTH-type transcriptional regulator/antitoxin HipB